MAPAEIRAPFSSPIPSLSGRRWYGLDVSAQNIEIANGAFYVTWLMLVPVPLGEDTSPIGSLQGWNIPAFGPLSNAQTNELMIRARH